jgi:hypothetical protein
MMRTYKCSLKTIVKDAETIDKLNKAVYKCNEIITLTYQFIKLYILDKYRNEQQIPKINKDFIRQSIITVTSKDDERGRQSVNDTIFIDIQNFYKTNFAKLINNYKPSRTNLSNPIKLICIDMEKNYKNNIQMHFVQHLKRVITESLLFAFELDNKELFKSNKDQYDIEKKLRLREISIIKLKVLGLDEYIEDTENNNNILKKNRKLIKMFKKVLLPNIEKNVYADIENDPFKFISKMIYINDKFEKMEIKTNNMLPLRHSFVPKNIQLDTNCIIEILLPKKGKRKAYGNIKKNEKRIWNKFFNKKLNKSYINSDYEFANVITTDGFSVSVLEAKSEHIKNKNNKYVKGYKKCKEVNIKKDKNDIKYITDLEEDKLNEIRNYKLIGVDPGKRNLIQMIDDDENIISYTASQRRHETRIALNEKKRKEDLEKNPNIKQKIEEFTVNAKTTNYIDFEKYIIERNKLTENVNSYYEKNFFRQLNWHRFINVQKSEKNLIEKIKNKYGDKILIGIGDWSESQQMKYSKPTKGIGMVRLLNTHFETYYINENYTSKICNNCSGETDYYKKVLTKDTFMNSKNKRKSKRIKKENIKHIHGLLCCKNKKCSKLWNRDTNGAKNILEILKSHINESIRPFALTSPTGRAVMLKFARMKVKTVPSLLRSQKIESDKCISTDLKSLNENILNDINQELIKRKKIKSKEKIIMNTKLSIIKSLKCKSLKQKINIMSQINL